jgi:methionine sulfoxide reductase heme-binding subunit
VIKTGPRLAAHALAAIPWLLMVWDTAHNLLGADPVRALEHRSGWWALVFLALCLSMTPLRKLTGAAIWLPLRRMLGLWCFALASMHLLIYLSLDLQQNWAAIFTEVRKRPYISVGFSAWLLLIPLAITSNKIMMRRLGRRWASLHKLVYLIAVLACLHFFWLVKKDHAEPLIFIGVFAALFAIRAWFRFTSTPPAARP